ncbi:LysR substrate-binding domain-containing protein [Cellulosimicrobium cellulans]|uniref:LysR substrate-binding domain-containing protein n=1 Tax=Cellulosimicrobium cellulans TaxID=1710 RepID=UPI0020CD8898|nr:substrate-binding domain-containing protein [Cellulosimicrobium cellulans]
MDDDAGTAPEATTEGGGDDGAGRRFRLAYVPGATPAKWVRTWRERLSDVPLDLVAVEPADAERALRDDEADAAILRLPVDRDVLSAIRLYEEAPVVLVSRDHLLAALEPEEPVALDDLADDVLLRPLDDVVPWAGEAGAADDAPPPPGRPADERPATTGDAVVLVAANVGVAVVPQSLARLHHRKDVTYRRLDGAPSAPVALAWVADRDDDLVEEMVGIVRGRTANSSRGRRAATPPEDAAPARERRDRDARGGAGRGGAGAGRGATGAGRAGGGRGGGGGAQGRGTPKGRGARGRGGKRR